MATVPSEPGKTILVADDDANVTMSITAYLQSLGYRTVSAPDGEAAMTAIKDDRPDLAILDIEMPKGSGIVITRELRSNPDRALRAIPVIILTAKADTRHEAYSDAAGATAFLAKPVALSDLADKVKDLLA